MTDAQPARRRRWLVGLLLFAILVRLLSLGAYPLTDNTEARYAELARTMVETGDWLTPRMAGGVPWWSKPPLAIWLTSVSYVAFGVNEFAARLPQLLLCLGTMWLTMNLAAQRNRPNLALRAAIVLFTSGLFFVSAGAVMTDPTLTLATTLSMAGFWNAMTRSDRSARAWGYVFFVGMAVGLLAKGPVGVVLTLLPCGLWTLWRRRIGDAWRRLPWITGTLLCAALSVPWYIAAETRTPGYLEYFIIGEHWKRYTIPAWRGDMFGTAHVRPRGFIWPLALIATMPWCITWLGLAWGLRRRDEPSRPPPDDTGWRAYLWLWMLASPVFFTGAGNILITYVLPGIPAFALLVADAWESVGDKGPNGVSTKIAALLIPVGGILFLMLVIPRVAHDYTHKALVAEYLARRTNASQRLVYFEEAPQSAYFYARGSVTTAGTAAEFESIVDERRGDFFVIKASELDDEAQLKPRLVLIGQYGKFLFMRGAPAAPGAQ
ncbi:MAG TPA: glycosyltransferase family 39 protein [Casimicrobiaceae bacterium]|nr:glycosyltransferase family 39 protein [Casimicrobiaceae bacterium]